MDIGLGGDVGTLQKEGFAARELYGASKQVS